MNWRIIPFILLFFIIAAAGISIAEPQNSMNPYPVDNPDSLPPEEPITIGPTDFPTEEPTFTVEPTQIGGDSGWISIDSSPQGADAYLDDSYIGMTPATTKVSSTGTPSHSVRVTKGGYQDWTGHISGNPAPGETLYQTAYLVAIPPTITVEPTQIGGDSGWFKIDSAPQGADVYFDGTYYGTSPVLVKVMVTATPSHDLKLTMNGYQEYRQRLSNNPGPSETVPLYVSLVPLAQYGSIVVTSDPSGALATLDQGIQYLTPCTFSGVVSGSHTISVSKSGYSTYTTQVQVNYNSQPRVYAPLTPIKTVGTLYLDSVPQGADIKVDNLWQGQTPQRIGNLAPGTHMVKLQLSGYQTVSQDVAITAGQETRIAPVLTPNPPQIKTGSISVTSNPPGAAVYLNNDYHGQTPDTGYLDLTDLIPGVYTIHLTAPQREDYTASITVNAGQTTPVNVNLNAPQTPSGVNGTLSVNSVPSGSQVYLDNIFIGVTPLTLSTVKPGQYTLVLKMTGYQDYTNQVQIAAGMSTPASVNLTPLAPSTPKETSTQTPVPTATRSPSALILVPAALFGALLRWHRPL